MCTSDAKTANNYSPKEKIQPVDNSRLRVQKQPEIPLKLNLCMIKGTVTPSLAATVTIRLMRSPDMTLYMVTEATTASSEKQEMTPFMAETAMTG